MTAEDQRSTLIVAQDAQTGLGRRLQGLSNLELSPAPWEWSRLSASRQNADTGA
jgi:hypothetical protein